MKENNTVKKYDIAVIGFGKGGKTFAGYMADLGKSVIMIERSHKMYGGTCINAGCIPSKSLIHSASFSLASTGSGGSFDTKKELYQQAVEEKRRLTSLLRQKNFDKLNTHAKVTVINGTASFVDEHCLKIKEEHTDTLIEADIILINTGASPFIPPIPGLAESKRAFISETLMDLDTLPQDLIIIGGGYIGMEFASMYANFGSRVTVIQDGSRFLPREDEEIAAAVLRSLLDRGINVILSAKIHSVEDIVNDGKACSLIHFEKDGELLSLSADAILTATGRRPNLSELCPENAGIELTDRGAIKTDEHLRTSVPHIYALGDVTGGLQFTYISLDDYRIVRSSLTGDGSRTTLNRGEIPYSVFLDPPFSRVGLSEKEALEKGYRVKTAKLQAASIPKAQVLKQTTGLLKAVIDEDTNLILGAHLFCEESHEMINLIKLVMDAKQPYTVLRDTIFTHPAMSEALNDLFA